MKTVFEQQNPEFIIANEREEIMKDCFMMKRNKSQVEGQ